MTTPHHHRRRRHRDSFKLHRLCFDLLSIVVAAANKKRPMSQAMKARRILSRLPGIRARRYEVMANSLILGTGIAK